MCERTRERERERCLEGGRERERPDHPLTLSILYLITSTLSDKETVFIEVQYQEEIYQVIVSSRHVR